MNVQQFVTHASFNIQINENINVLKFIVAVVVY
jgi:hypothetical protein